MSDYEPIVKVEGTDVFFYCEVSQETILELHVALTRLERDFHCPRIRIHIQSEGGDIYAGLASLDFIKSMKSHVTTIVEGRCASAATFIYLGGDERIVRPNGYVLIHQLSHEIWGKFDDLQDEIHQCQKLMRHIKRIYLRETQIPEKKLDKLLKRDLYLSARRCKKYLISLDLGNDR